MQKKKLLSVVTVSAVLVTGLVCGTMAAGAETGTTEIVTNVFDSTSFEHVSHAMDCNQDGIVNVYDMTMLLDFLHSREDAVAPNVQVNQRIVDATGKAVDEYMAMNHPELFAVVTEKDIYADTYSMEDVESGGVFPTIVTLKLSRPMSLDEIYNVTKFSDSSSGNFFDAIVQEVKEQNGEDIDYSDFVTEYDELRITLYNDVRSGEVQADSHVTNVIPVKNGDMTGTVITNTDGRIASVKRYLAMNTSFFSMISDYTVSDDAEQADDTEQFSKVTVKLAQPMSVHDVYDECDSSGLRNRLQESFIDYLENNDIELEEADRNILVTEMAFPVQTVKDGENFVSDMAAFTFSVK